MTSKPIVPRELARQDIDQAIGYYLVEAGADVAMGFIDSLENAYGALADFPKGGSPRFAHELNLPGLRSWQLEGYRYLVFYMELDDKIDVWRVLHARRDIYTHVVDTD
ncbi:type II toxin-antitoxin system RelE/ParE family toxin [Sphingomonas sp. dw_22]|uniref:type II toxin-antitoxin system RelE/ParE family toxin n=1 Tax=Sphingomonas sp. dw_22 TaxID=2721175 RepID=UPI001BD4CFF3|nr:type II toxin-antitoxin system RelE/ParE family toxin [Sphingomonas sp. dw_22]